MAAKKPTKAQKQKVKIASNIASITKNKIAKKKLTDLQKKMRKQIISQKY